MPHSGDPPDGGHRVVPHTADLIVEAWGPSRLACLEEAARGLVDAFARVDDTAVSRRHAVELDASTDEHLVHSLLDEVVYVLDALGGVPAAVTLTERDGGVRASFDVVPFDAVETHGPVPKGVSLGDLILEREGDRWTCRATIDV